MQDSMQEEEDDSEERCFVCFESQGHMLRNRCACRSRIHHACMTKLLNMNQSSKGRVCLEEIKGVEERVRFKLRILTKVLIVTYYIFISVITTFIFIVLLSVGHSELVWIIPYSATWSLLAMFLVMLLHRNVYRRYGGQFGEFKRMFVVVGVDSTRAWHEGCGLHALAMFSYIVMDSKSKILAPNQQVLTQESKLCLQPVLVILEYPISQGAWEGWPGCCARQAKSTTIKDRCRKK